eukprot:757383-Hanusia_phi.AAC.10
MKREGVNVIERNVQYKQHYRKMGPQEVRLYAGFESIPGCPEASHPPPPPNESLLNSIRSI